MYGWTTIECGWFLIRIVEGIWSLSQMYEWQIKHTREGTRKFWLWVRKHNRNISLENSQHEISITGNSLKTLISFLFLFNSNKMRAVTVLCLFVAVCFGKRIALVVIHWLLHSAAYTEKEYQNGFVSWMQLHQKSYRHDEFQVHFTSESYLMLHY